MSIIVHHLEYSRSTRVLWLLEELGAEYELRRYRRTKAWRAPPELDAIHPVGRAPLIQVDGRAMAESGAILEWIVADSGLSGAAEFGPQTDEERQHYRFFMHYAEGSVMPPLVMRLVLRKAGSAPVPFFAKPVLRAITQKIEAAYPDGEISRSFDFLDRHMEGRTWLLGDRLTAADVQMVFPVEAGLARGAGERPHLAAWLDRIRARPAWQRALDKGGPLTPG